MKDNRLANVNKRIYPTHLESVGRLVMAPDMAREMKSAIVACCIQFIAFGWPTQPPNTPRPLTIIHFCFVNFEFTNVNLAKGNVTRRLVTEYLTWVDKTTNRPKLNQTNNKNCRY